MDSKPTAFQQMPSRIAGLVEIASNLWWSWHPAARMLFKNLNRRVWKESTHNPVRVIRELLPDALAPFANDHQYLGEYDAVIEQFRNELAEKDCWCDEKIAAHEEHTVAYFSAEYGLHHSLPFYAGGLGFLAGDHIKECSDLKIPLVAVGFMYPEGYVLQHIRDDGWQESIDQPLYRDAASINRVLDDKGNQLVVKVPFIEPPIHVAVWKIDVGRIPLYLMDTDIEQNDPWNRGISARLYIGDRELRLRQEIVLGIGGDEVLDTLGIHRSILHLNEGHPAFALLERIREKVSEEKLPFEEAARQVRNTSIFTTHTPVAAGHDVFPFALMEKYFSSYWPSLGITHDEFLQLGVNPSQPRAGFNMTVMALKLATFRNGVSLRHGEVTRKMWQCLWPDRTPEKVPIESVTNGIHVPTWVEPKMELLYNRYLGEDWIARHDDPATWERIDEIPDEDLWKTHYWLKIKLIDAVRERVRQRWAKDRISASKVLAGGTLLDPSVLTLGFARRFATYKRADLILRDLERLKRMLNDRWRPIQIIFAGKAHPADDEGKRLLQQVFRAASNQDLGGRIAFVEDYGEQFAQYLVHGVDVWLNNPLPPLEACGTSGMKAALNGVPQLSILDGWWVEGYNGKNGWAITGAEDVENRDDVDAAAIYDLLEKEIIPLYYTTSEDGIPHGWVRVMRETIRSNAPRYSTRRMVKEYRDRFYAPALQAIKEWK
ncbi:MAG TPA: alpha-glucan family phosphorylase [Syntrophales bacterium]|nr:alpha-glucan family phosphorylase [Syntrophales bacterium]